MAECVRLENLILEYVGSINANDKNMSSRECHTQSVEVDEQVTLLGGIQVHLQPALLLIFIVMCFFNCIITLSIWFCKPWQKLQLNEYKLDGL